jgi:O-antigen/teichoic acid export membrane protein
MHSLNVTNALISTWIGGWIATSVTLRFLIQSGDMSLLPDVILLKQSFRYSIRVHLGTLANLANGRLDQLIMTAIISTKSLGLYAFAVTLSEMLNQVASAISLAIMPKVAGESDMEVKRMIAIRSVRWTLLIGTIGAILLYVIAPYAIQLLWGNRFVESTPVVRVLLPGTVMLGIARTLCSTMRGIDKPMAGTWAELASLAVMIPMLIYLLPRLGIVGAGIASSCGYAVNGIVLVGFFGKIFGWHSLYELRPSRSDWDYARASIAKILDRKNPVPALPFVKGG